MKNNSSNASGLNISQTSEYKQGSFVEFGSIEVKRNHEFRTHNNLEFTQKHGIGDLALISVDKAVSSANMN